jgi:hypothetical protein
MSDAGQDLGGLLASAREAKAKMDKAISEGDYPYAAGRGISFVNQAITTLEHTTKAGTDTPGKKGGQTP